MSAKRNEQQAPQLIENVKVKWLKASKEDIYGRFTVDIEATKENMARFEELAGRKPKPKLDDEGDMWFTISRTAVNKSTGEPEVVKIVKDGEIFKGLVGNGSYVDIWVMPYSYKAGTNDKGQSYAGGTALSWYGATIVDLVVYESDDNDSDSNSSSIDDSAMFVKRSTTASNVTELKATAGSTDEDFTA